MCVYTYIHTYIYMKDGKVIWGRTLLSVLSVLPAYMLSY